MKKMVIYIQNLVISTLMGIIGAMLIQANFDLEWTFAFLVPGLVYALIAMHLMSRVRGAINFRSPNERIGEIDANLEQIREDQNRAVERHVISLDLNTRRQWYHILFSRSGLEYAIYTLIMIILAYVTYV